MSIYLYVGLVTDRLKGQRRRERIAALEAQIHPTSPTLRAQQAREEEDGPPPVEAEKLKNVAVEAAENEPTVAERALAGPSMDCVSLFDFVQEPLALTFTQEYSKKTHGLKDGFMLTPNNSVSQPSHSSSINTSLATSILSTFRRSVLKNPNPQYPPRHRQRLARVQHCDPSLGLFLSPHCDPWDTRSRRTPAKFTSGHCATNHPTPPHA